MSALPHFNLTPEEYLELERKAEFKSEYADGIIYQMGGADWNHLQIVSNLIVSLRDTVRVKECAAVASDLKVRTPDSHGFFYPDVAVICGPPQFHDKHTDTILNPVALIEVWSPTAIRFSKHDRFLYYQQITSLHEYLLIRSDCATVEHYINLRDGSWSYMAHIGLESSLALPMFECDLALSDVYADVEWEDEAEQ